MYIPNKHIFTKKKSIYLNITLHFHLIAINMHLSVWKHYIQFTRKYIVLQYIISIIIIFKNMIKCTSLKLKRAQ